jgi:hypothetical protein
MKGGFCYAFYVIIRSSFRDYYDGIRSALPDPVVYNRETVEVPFASPFVVNDLPRNFPSGVVDIDRYYDRNDSFGEDFDLEQPDACFFRVVGFCGRFIVVLTDGRSSHSSSFSRTLFGRDILELPWSSGKRKRQPPIVDVVGECVERFHNSRDIGLFREFGVPLFMASVDAELSRYEQRNIALYVPKVVLNPCLVDGGFAQFLDPFSAHTEIEQFLSGVLGVPSPPTIEVSNDVKIVKAGFDDKTSFRKRG